MTAVKKLLSVGFDDFKDFLCDLERLKKEENHPFRVYNSEKAEHYNKRLINASNSSPTVDSQRFLTLITVFTVYIMVNLDLVVGRVFIKVFEHSEKVARQC